MAEPSRIKVTPAEEEDIVIQAGAVQEPAVVSQSVSAAPKTDEAEAVASETVPSEPVRCKDDFKETTLADLEHAGMSGMQKAIIAAAIVAVAAFIIWYVLLH